MAVRRRGRPSWPPPAARVRGAAPATARWPAWPPRPTWWSTAWWASPGCRSPWPRCEAGRRLALANKESLIAAGPVVQRARRTPGAELVPVDSEHGAIHQCLRANDNPARVARAGADRQRGPFRGRSRAELGVGHHRRRPGPPDLVDGPQDHGRLVHADEQGPRGHRGPRAVRGAGRRRRRRHRLRPDRGGRAPPVDRPLDGRPSPTAPPSPSSPSPTCACPSATPWPTPTAVTTPVRAHRLGHARPPRLRAARPRRLRLPRPGLRRRPGRAAPPRPGSTPPTRWRWPPSWPGASAGPRSPTCWPPRSSSTTAPRRPICLLWSTSTTAPAVAAGDAIERIAS